MRGQVYLEKMRVFLACPSDLALERRKLSAVLGSLRRVAENCRVTLELLDWHQVVPDAGRPEQVILDQLQPETWDVFIGILWYRFGTSTGANDPATGAEYASGTEEEFRLAHRLWQRFKRPRVLFYRCARNPKITAIEPEQFGRVTRFFDEVAAKKAHAGLYHTYKTTTAFEQLVREHFEQILFARLKQPTGGEQPPDRDRRRRIHRDARRPTPDDQVFASLVLRGIKETYYRALDEHMTTCPRIRVNVMIPNSERRLEIRFVDDPRYYSKPERAKTWKPGEGKCGTAWQDATQQIYVRNAAMPDQFLEPMQADDETVLALQSVISTPVRHNGKVIGVLNIDSPDDGSVTKVGDGRISALLGYLADRLSPLLLGRSRRS